MKLNLLKTKNNNKYVIKEWNSSRIILNTEIKYDIKDLAFYKEKFNELKREGIIINDDFRQHIWTCNKKGHKINIRFSLGKYPKNLIAVKCLVILLLENGITPRTIASNINLLLRCINISHFFQVEYIEEFENFIYECTSSQLRRIKVITQAFLNYLEIEYFDDYMMIIDMIRIDKVKARILPDYKSILVFDHIVNYELLNSQQENKLKFFSLYLWWKITGVIPLRPSEFLNLKYNSCWKDEKGRCWLKLPRSKVKQTSIKYKIDIVDEIETTEDIYNLIEEYKSLVKLSHQGEYLISYKAHNSYLQTPKSAMNKKIDVNRMELSQISHLFHVFYEEIVQKKHNYYNITPLKPGDSRHLAFCNMMFQGYNPLTIARMGGHTNLYSQIHYYGHLDVFAESYVSTMVNILHSLRYLSIRNSACKFHYIRKCKLIYTYSESELNNFLKIGKGYCLIKDKDTIDFSDCSESCYYCPQHLLDIINHPEVIKELNDKSDALDNVIKEQIEVLKNMSKSFYLDYSTERYSPKGNSEVLSFSSELQTNLNRKILIDTAILDYIMEDNYEKSKRIT